MQTFQSIKALIARLAGAPPPRSDPSPPIVPRHRSGLYETATASRSVRTPKQRDGDEGEAFARRHLERAGLAFVTAQVAYRDGELDLVMRDARGDSTGGATLVFVEVRRRSGGSHGGAAASITREKRRRIVAAAAHYLVGLRVRHLPPCRFDVVTVDGDRRSGYRIEWLPDAFRDEG